MLSVSELKCERCSEVNFYYGFVSVFKNHLFLHKVPYPPMEFLVSPAWI